MLNIKDVHSRQLTSCMSDFSVSLTQEGKDGGGRKALKAACSPFCCRRVVTLVSVFVEQLLHRRFLAAAPA